MGKMFNRVKMTVSGTAGTGDITLNAASPGFQTFATAGVSVGDVVSYTIEDGTAFEVGQGTYLGATLRRDVLQTSSTPGSKISVTSSAVVFITAAASDFQGAVTLVDDGTIVWNGALSPLATVTLGGNRYIEVQNIQAGSSYRIQLVQDATGSRTVTWSPMIRWASDTAPTLSTAAGASDVIELTSNGVNIYGRLLTSYTTAPTVATNFAAVAGDWQTLPTLSSMPTGGSISRAGNAMLYDSTGKLTWASNNLLTYSEQFDNAAWAKFESTITANTTTAPDGTTTADTIVENTANAQHNTYQTISTTGKKVFSVYAKLASGTRLLRMIDYNATDGAQSETYFNLSTGVVASGTGSISSVGNGWYRCSITSTTTVTSTYYISIASAVSNFSYTGDGTSGLYVWGAQLEAVTYQTTPSTYVATTSAAYYGPRFDYDPSTLAAKGLLIEGTRTNLALNSNFQGTWAARNGAAITVNNAISPDGTQNAAKIDVASAANSDVYQYITATAGNTLTFSVWLKGSVGGETVRLQYYNSTDGAVYKVVTLTTSWQRFTFTATPFISSTWYVASNGVAVSVYAFGAQLEVGAFASSLNPTTSASSARAAETFAITGYSSNLINATYIDEQTGVTSVQPYNAGVAPSPSFAWLTALRVYTNAYAGNIATPSWLSFSRTGNALVTDSTGKLTWAPANMLTYSQAFSSWATLSEITITSNSTIAPDGTNTASLVAETVNSNAHYSGSQNVTFGLGDNLIYSLYVKKGPGASAPDIFQLTCGSPSIFGTVYANFNISTGVVTASSGVTASISSVGNGWYRCSIIVSVTAAGSGAMQYAFTNNNGTAGRVPVYAGNTAANIYIWGAQLERVTYQTQPSAYILTTTAAVYGPRYDFDASTVPSTPRGLLIEESRANLLTYSEQFDNAAWTKSLSTITANTATSPDGTTTADKMVPNNTAVGANLAETFTSVNGTSYTLSCYAKAGEFASFILLMPNTWFSDVTNRYATFNLSAGTYTTTGTGATGSITHVGNGWYRCALTATASASASAGFQLRINTTGDGVSGIYLWGAQLEAASFASSYIPTTSVSVTRAADVAQLTGSALTAVGGTSASAIAEVGGAAGSYPQILNSNLSALIAVHVNGNIYTTKTDAAALQAALGSGTYNGQFRAAVSFTTGALSLVGNNGTVATAALGYQGAPITNLRLGSASNGYYMNNYVRSLALYNQRLPDAILKSKSTVGAPY